MELEKHTGPMDGNSKELLSMENRTEDNWFHLQCPKMADRLPEELELGLTIGAVFIKTYQESVRDTVKTK